MKRVLVVVFLAGALMFLGATCSTEKANENEESNGNEVIGGIGMSNPAASYCVDLGYISEDGSCVFGDGTSCNEWDFMRGICGQDKSYCSKEGGTLTTRTEDMDGWSSEYGVCQFDDGTVCAEQQFFSGECKAGECKEWKESDGGCVK